MLIHNPIFTGSISLNGTDISQVSTVSTDSSSFASRITNNESTSSAYVTTSGSFSNRITNTESTASAFILASGSFSTRTTAVEATASQYVTASGSLAARLTSNEAKTGSFATTGSNFFIGNQVITGSVYIANDLIVQGSSSLQNITASAVSVGTNTIILNTATPILQFGGISVFDSGSTMGRSGSLLWNSINDHWINVNPSGSDEGYNSAMVINGPKNTGSLGSEAGLTTNYIPVSQGEDHITDSVIYQNGTSIGIGTTSPSAIISGTETTLNVKGGIAGAVGSIVARSYGTSNTTSIGIAAFDSINMTAIYTESNSPMALYTNSTERIRINSSGSVGIGVTSPLSKLDVATESTEALCVGSLSGTITSGDLIGALSFVSRDGSTYSSGGVANIRSYATQTYNTGNVAADLRFYVSNGLQNTTAAAIFGTEAMRITNEGKVGIGTTSPLRNLHVYADDANGIGIGKNLTDANLSANLYFYPSSVLSDKRNWGITTYYDRTELLQFRRSSTTTSDPYNSGVTVMTLDGKNDRVGIGTISPGYVLEVSGNAAFSSYVYADAFAASGNNTISGWSANIVRPIIEGREGNAISNYVGLPEMYYTSNAYYDGSNWIRKTANASMNMVLSGYNNNFVIQSAASGTAGAAVSFVSRFYINGSNGNVGIGLTTNIDQKLTVNGRIRVSSDGTNGGDMAVNDGGLAFSSISSSPIEFFTSNYGSERMRITSGGHVLIGQTTASGNSNGIYFRPGIESGFIVTSDVALQLSRLGTTGNIQTFYSGTTRVGKIAVGPHWQNSGGDRFGYRARQLYEC
jgi:hypothetical protein